MASNQPGVSRVLLLVAVLLVVPWVGCLSSGGQSPSPETDPEPRTSPSKTRAELDRVLPFATNASDGTTLRGHVYLPHGTGPFATVLVLSPWWNVHPGWGHTDAQATTVDGRRTLSEPWQPLMDAGFAVAMVNPRGTGESEGCFQLGGPVDGRDAHSVIQTLANASWSNGNVGMYGHSFAAWYQYVALMEDPPALKAIVPVSGVTDTWNLATRNGAPFAGIGPVFHPLLTALTAGGQPGTDGFTPDTSADHLACPNYPRGASESARLAWNGDHTSWWDKRRYLGAIEAAEVPTLVTNGLTTNEGHILQIEDLWPRLPEDDRWMVLGQWDHPETRGNQSQFPASAIDWLDQHLRADAAAPATNTVRYQDDTGEWHTTDTWPPRGTTERIFLTGGGLVAGHAQVETSAETFASATHDPCLSKCTVGQKYRFTASQPVSCPPTQALYTSPPLDEDVLLAGNFHVNITLTSTQPDGNLAAFLYHTPGDGECPDSEAEEVRRALTDLRHPSYRADGRPFPVGEPTTTSVRSVPLASVIPAGHRLVLAIGGGSADLFPEARQPILTVSTGPDAIGHVDLPVVAGDLSFDAS